MVELDTEQEVWSEMRRFPGYLISNLGRVWNKKRERVMSPSLNNYGHLKISLYDAYGIRRTFFVATLVGEAFVEAPDRRCNRIMILNGVLASVSYWNLAWRPKWFVWQYYRQLRTSQHIFYKNLPVRDLTHAKEYESIIKAGMDQGLLYDDIWRSTSTGDVIYPNHSVFRVINGV